MWESTNLVFDVSKKMGEHHVYFVLERYINCVLDKASEYKISKFQSLLHNNCSSLENSLDLLNKPLTILFVSKTIVEDTKHLMDPETNKGLLIFHRFLLDKANTEDDTTEVTQIEDIM